LYHAKLFILLSLFALVACENKETPDNFNFPCSTENSEGIKKALIIGDSISIGYTPYAINELCDQGFFVTRIWDNSRSTRYTLDNIDSWLGDEHWDLITFNQGLWDMPAKWVQGAELDVVRDVYKVHLSLVANKILERTDRAIFFTTTPVAMANRFYKPEHVVMFNEDAVEVLESRPEISIEDLYGYAMDYSAIHHADGVHFSPEGSELLSDFVIDSMLRAL